MSLTLLDNQTRASPGTFFPQLGGGGGGSNVSTFVTADVSTLAVSSIATLVVGQAPNVPNGLDFPGGANISFVAGGGGPDIQFSANNGAITGLSSINGAVYPPPSAPLSISTFTTSGVSGGQGESLPLNGVPFNTAVGKWYSAQIEITDMTFLAPGPSANDCFGVSIEDATSQTNLGTFNMAQVSTNRGALGDLGFSLCGPFESLSTNAYFVFKQSSNSCSTFTVTGGTGWLTLLN